MIGSWHAVISDVLWLSRRLSVCQTAGYWNTRNRSSDIGEMGSELKAGDIIYSGTSENVGLVVRGDVMLGHIDGLPDIPVQVAEK